jgi:hypothetical protein
MALRYTKWPYRTGLSGCRVSLPCCQNPRTKLTTETTVAPGTFKVGTVITCPRCRTAFAIADIDRGLVTLEW